MSEGTPVRSRGYWQRLIGEIASITHDDDSGSETESDDSYEYDDNTSTPANATRSASNVDKIHFIRRKLLFNRALSEYQACDYDACRASIDELTADPLVASDLGISSRVSRLNERMTRERIQRDALVNVERRSCSNILHALDVHILKVSRGERTWSQFEVDLSNDASQIVASESDVLEAEARMLTRSSDSYLNASLSAYMHNKAGVLWRLGWPVRARLYLKRGLIAARGDPMMEARQHVLSAQLLHADGGDPFDTMDHVLKAMPQFQKHADPRSAAGFWLLAARCLVALPFGDWLEARAELNSQTTPTPMSTNNPVLLAKHALHTALQLDPGNKQVQHAMDEIMHRLSSE